MIEKQAVVMQVSEELIERSWLARDEMLMTYRERLEYMLQLNLSRRAGRYLDLRELQPRKVFMGHLDNDFLRGTVRCVCETVIELKAKPHLKKKRRVSWVKAKAI